MRLCIATHNFPCAPGESVDAGVFVADLAGALAGAGHQITVVCPNIQREKGVFPGLHVEWFPWTGGGKKLRAFRPWNPADVARLYSLFSRGADELARCWQRQQFGRVLAMWAVPSGYFAWRLKRRHGVPYDVWALGSDIWNYARIPGMRQIVRAVLRGADQVFADGLALRAEAERLCGRPVHYVRSSRRLSREGTSPVAVDPTRTNFLFVGRWERNKGIDLLVEAAARLLLEGAALDLHVFGGGSLEGKIRRIVERTGTGAHIRIGGYATPPVLASYLASCDALVVPSRRETFAIVLIDALQVDTPAVVTDVGEMGALVAQYHAGTVAARAAVPELEAALREFMRAGKGAFTANLGALRDLYSIDRIATDLMQRLEGTG